MEKKLYRFQPKVLHNFFVRIFKIITPPPSNMRKKLKKFSRIDLLTQLFYVKILKFWTSPFESTNFWILAIYGHIIRVRVRGSSQKFFWDGFTSRLTFWVSFSLIVGSADFTILCGKALSTSISQVKCKR